MRRTARNTIRICAVRDGTCLASLPPFQEIIKFSCRLSSGWKNWYWQELRERSPIAESLKCFHVNDTTRVKSLDMPYPMIFVNIIDYSPLLIITRQPKALDRLAPLDSTLHGWCISGVLFTLPILFPMSANLPPNLIDGKLLLRHGKDETISIATRLTC